MPSSSLLFLPTPNPPEGPPPLPTHPARARPYHGSTLPTPFLPLPPSLSLRPQLLTASQPPNKSQTPIRKPTEPNSTLEGGREGEATDCSPEATTKP